MVWESNVTREALFFWWCGGSNGNGGSNGIKQWCGGSNGNGEASKRGEQW
jgi:hypothetical protein